MRARGNVKLFINYRKYKRTNTLSFGVVECESGVARDALRSAVHRAFQTTLRQPILACAYIRYGVMMYTFKLFPLTSKLEH